MLLWSLALPGLDGNDKVDDYDDDVEMPIGKTRTGHWTFFLNLYSNDRNLLRTTMKTGAPAVLKEFLNRERPLLCNSAASCTGSTRKKL